MSHLDSNFLNELLVLCSFAYNSYVYIYCVYLSIYIYIFILYVGVSIYMHITLDFFSWQGLSGLANRYFAARDSFMKFQDVCLSSCLNS